MKLGLTLVALILLELFLVVLFTAPMFHDSREKAMLVLKLSQCPAEETDAKLQAIHSKESLVELIFRCVVAAFILADGYAIFVIVRKIRKYA